MNSELNKKTAIIEKKKKIIGILGGMGPEATCECFFKIIRNTLAQKDQDHVNTVIVSNPEIPDRTTALVDGGVSPVRLMIEGCLKLKEARADFIIIPCVTAHYFLAQVQRQIDIPFLSILDVVAEEIVHQKFKTVGLMATAGTVKSGIFQRRLAKENIQVVLPDETDQKQLMEVISAIKKGLHLEARGALSSHLIQIAENLIKGIKGSRKAEAIIAGCTEIPILLTQQDLTIPCLDSLNILARAALIKAGYETLCN